MKNLLGFIYTKKITFSIFMVMILAVLVSKPISAAVSIPKPIAVYQLDVSYTNGSIASSGPLSFGLSELPTSVTATFILDSGTVGLNAIHFYASDVISANVTFGDATWTESLLNNFYMSLSSGVSSLSYAFLPTTSLTAEGPIVLNFPLSITGTDKASGLPFEYGYTVSIQTLTPVVQTQTLDVAIDIKPNSDKNCFNINGHGVIPVAILGNMNFSVSQIDIASLSFGGLAVRVRGNKGALCSIEYSNEDEYLDLICHFEDNSSNWDAGDGDAMVTGSLIDGTTFEGSDSICVAP